METTGAAGPGACNANRPAPSFPKPINKSLITSTGADIVMQSSEIELPDDRGTGQVRGRLC